MVFLEHSRGVFALGEVVQADGDELKVPAAIHPVHRDQFGQLGDARAAPGCPEVHEQELLGVVLGEFGHAGQVDGFEPDRLGVPLRQRFLGIGLFVGPLGRAAEDAGRRDRDRLAGQQGLHGVLGVVRFDGLDLAIVESSDVAELALAVEDINLRRGQDAVGPGRRLRLAVVEIGISVVVIFRADLHVFKRVAEVGIAELVQANGGGVVG